jgi:hypothetical protein
MQYLALIQPADFAEFRAILGTKLGANYTDWLRRHTDRRHELSDTGQRSRGVTLHPREFVRYCERRGTSPSLGRLDEFASAKAHATGPH